MKVESDEPQTSGKSYWEARMKYNDSSWDGFFPSDWFEIMDHFNSALDDWEIYELEENKRGVEMEIGPLYYGLPHVLFEEV